MKKKSIFLVGAMMLMMGGEIVTGRHVLLASATNLQNAVQEKCQHESVSYINSGLTHEIECEYCDENIGTEAHVDEDGNMRCDACNVKLTTVAPTTAEGFVSSTLTLSESVKISIKANKNEVNGIAVSGWYENELDNTLDAKINENGEKYYADSLYTVKAEYNEDTDLYEAEIKFADINGADGMYYFDAIIYGNTSTMRYVRLSNVEYTKSGISKVSTTRLSDGNIEVSLNAVDGGEVYISTNGEEPTEESEWVSYSAGDTYTIDDENDSIDEIDVYYRNAEMTTFAMTPRTLSVRASTVSTDMVTEWTIPTANTPIILPVSGDGLNITVNWGDGNAETVTKGFPTHTYTAAGTYNITISGTCPLFGYYERNEVKNTSQYYTFTKYLTGVQQLGELNATRYGFSNCKSLKYVYCNATSNTFFNVRNMSNMFYLCNSVEILDISGIDTRNITDMSNMFYNCSVLEYIDVSSFNTINVTNMKNMFSTCNKLKEIDVRNFNTSNVTDFSGMFDSCNQLMEVDVSGFDVSKATDLSRMFAACKAIKYIDVSEFYPKTIFKANRMFYNCTNMEHIDLSNFNMEHVTTTEGIFYNTLRLKSIMVGNEFKLIGENLFNGSPLDKIIILDENPVDSQFTNIKLQIPNVIFYVPSVEAETNYQIAWSEDFTIDRIEPLLQLEGDYAITIGTYEDFETEDYMVAGSNIENSGDFGVYGYRVNANIAVDETKAGENQIEYILFRTVDGSTSRIMSVIKNVTVVKYRVKPPLDFKATQLADDKVITVTWSKHRDPNVKYELSAKTENSDWVIIENNANTPYAHRNLSQGDAYEYRIRSYDADGYSEYIYTQGSTAPKIISGDAVLDTVLPRITYLNHLPSKRYLISGDRFEISFDVSDTNYYKDYNKIGEEKVIFKIGDTEIDISEVEVEKTDITNGENVKIIIPQMPYTALRGELFVILEEGIVKDKALNKNEELIVDTNLFVANSNITTDAPTVEIDYNNITITCNQETDIEPENAIIYYEYRKIGDSIYTVYEENTINNLKDDQYYEVRTTLVDSTGNRVSSETTVVYIESMTPTVVFEISNIPSGTYVMNTDVKIVAKFDKPLTIVEDLKLNINFGDGGNIRLTGTYDSENLLVEYTYKIQRKDLGKLNGIKFTGEIRALNGKYITYDMIPEITGSEIYARTGVARSLVSGESIYYPYLQDAIDAVNTTGATELVVMYLDEEITAGVNIPDTKNIMLDLNGKDVISKTQGFATITNRGTLAIREEIGTGEISSYGTDEARAIINYGTLNVNKGTIMAKLENPSGEAYGIYNYGNVVFGTEDGNVNIVFPIVDSDGYGIYTTSIGNLKFFDGTLKGLKGRTYFGSMIISDGYNLVTKSISETKEMTYLGVDRMPPRIDYEILTPGWRNDFVDVKVSVFDEESGIRVVRLNNEDVTLDADNSFTTRFEENGRYLVYAEDNMGNSAPILIEIGTIDKEPPKIQNITLKDELSETEVEIAVSARDYQSGLAGIIMKDVDEIPTDDEDWILFDKYPTSKQIISMIITRGANNYCFAKDRAGNIGKYEGEIKVENIDKIAPVIQSVEIVKEPGKDYIIGKGIIVNVKATDNVGVTEILLADKNMSYDELLYSNDWQEYSETLLHKLPVEGDKVYTIYVWVKDAAGNMSLQATASAELKALIIGDNEQNYVGEDFVYNKSKLSFRAKDWNYDYNGTLELRNVMLRISSGDNVIRNVTTGLTLQKISDYVDVGSDNYRYKGEVYELQMQNIPSTGNLSLVILGGAITDLARNTIGGVSQMTDIFIDNTPPKISAVNTGAYDDKGIQIRNIIVTDSENNLIEAVIIESEGIKKSYALNRGKIELPLKDGDKITAYDKAGNDAIRIAGNAVDPTLLSERYKVELVYGGEGQKFGYTYNGDGAIYIESSDTNVANASINMVTKEIAILPVNAGFCEITVRTLGTTNFTEAKMSITVEVKPRPVTLEWPVTSFTYDGTAHQVTAKVTNAILGDNVIIEEYKNNIKINAGNYEAEAIKIENPNYTVENGINIKQSWVINKAQRELNLSATNMELEISGDDEIGIITFTYTGGEPDKGEVTIEGEKLVSTVIENAHGEGIVKISPQIVGNTRIIITIPESTNYAAISKTCDLMITKKITVTFDSDGGLPTYQQKVVMYGHKYGELPTSIWGNRKLLGWYTGRIGTGEQITADTTVTIKDRHTLYAYWNRKPENVSITVYSKTTNSITFRLFADDLDGDPLTFDIYLNNAYYKTVSANPGVAVNTTIDGLGSYVVYDYYTVVSDGIESTTSSTGSVRTYCSGTGYTCYTDYCNGYTNTYVDCSRCGGDGLETFYCDGESTTSCGSCGGDGEISYTCSGGSSSTCGTCNGTGKCPDSPQKVDQGTDGVCSTCGKDITWSEWECKTCGVTGSSRGCPNRCDYYQSSNHWNDDGSPKPDCPSCGGSGSSSSTCSHNQTSSHTAYKDCGSCGGDGSITTSCIHDYTSGHNYNETCSNCGGDGDVLVQTQPCPHGYSSGSHYRCSHFANTQSSSHQYCSHNRTEQHDS